MPAALRPVAYLGEHVPLAPGRVLLDPRVFAKLLDALERRAGGSRCSTSAAASATRPRCWRRWPRRWWRSSPTRHGGRGRGAARGARGGQRRGAGRAARRRRGRARAVRRDHRRGRHRGAAASASPASSSWAAGSPRSSPRAAGGQARLGLRSRQRASPGGVSSMQRPRCCRGSRRRKHLNFEPMRRIVRAGARPTGRRRRAALGRNVMHRQTLKSLLLSSTLAVPSSPWAARAPARAGLPRRRAGQGLPDQPAAGIEPRGAARRRRDPAAGARRAPAAGRRLGQRRRPDRPPRRSRTSSTSAQAALNASLLHLRQRRHQGGGRVGAQPDRRRPRRPQGRRAAGALQRGAGLRRRAPRPGVRAPGQQRRRAPRTRPWTRPATASRSAR